MNGKATNSKDSSVTRRGFLKASAVTAGSLSAAAAAVAQNANAAGSDTVRIGLIGCGGRGTGAAFNALEASDRVRIVALADVFKDRLDSSRKGLAENSDRAQVADDRCYVGFDAYKELVASDVDMVILATPPHFRPFHFLEAVNAGHHVFMEKPVAVDPAGVRKVIEGGAIADSKGLSVVSGTQRRHQDVYLEAMKRIHGGAIGDIVSARCYWNQGGLWMKEPQNSWSDMEWQLRNWLYFTWLSGDHIVEQHVHNIDVVNWAVGATPIRAMGMGGRQVRTDPNYGQIFDHFAIEFEYPNNVYATSMCRQIDGCANRVAEAIHGTKGWASTGWGGASIKGDNPWKFEKEKKVNPYVQEHVDLVASIGGGEHLNEARRIAESTLCAIMGRMSAYTGKAITWEEAMNSKLDLTPDAYKFGDMEIPPVAVPGKTPLI